MTELEKVIIEIKAAIKAARKHRIESFVMSRKLKTKRTIDCISNKIFYGFYIGLVHSKKKASRDWETSVECCRYTNLKYKNLFKNLNQVKK